MNTVFRQTKFFNRARKKGFSLVEVLLALAVLGMAILSILGLLTAAFESVSNNLQTSQALTVYSRVDRAFAKVSEFTGTDGRQIISESELSKPSFDYIYEWIRDKKGTAWDDALFLVCYSRRINPDSDSAPQRVMQVIKSDSKTALPTKSELDDLNYEGNVYLVRAFISPQLDGSRVEMNATGEVQNSLYSVGSPLPASPDSYALAYLPVTVEIYPFTVGVSEQGEDQFPIFSQTIVIQR